jgi:hypothetical protein
MIDTSDARLLVVVIVVIYDAPSFFALSTDAPRAEEFKSIPILVHHRPSLSSIIFDTCHRIIFSRRDDILSMPFRVANPNTILPNNLSFQ